MTAHKSVAHRLGRVLEALTRQSGRLPETPDYGSWLLGKSSESQRRRRVRIQVILTVFILSANLLGLGAALLLVTVAFPVPSIFSDAPAWITWVVCPVYIVLALLIGTFWITRRTCRFSNCVADDDASTWVFAEFSSKWRNRFLIFVADPRTVRLCRFWHRYVRAGFVWQLAADRGRSRMPHDFRRYDGEKLERQHVPVSHQL